MSETAQTEPAPAPPSTPSTVSPSPGNPASPRLENVLKIIAALVTIAGVIPGVLSALETARINAKTAEQNAKNAEIASLTARREAQKPFLDKLVPLYVQMGQVTGRIASAADNPNGITNALTTPYHELYAGEFRLFANKEVLDRLEDFEKALQAAKKDATDRDTLDANSLSMGAAAMKLGRAMHDHIWAMTGGL